MLAKWTRRGAALALSAALLATGVSAVPTGSAEAGWRGYHGYHGGWRPYPYYGYHGHYGYRYNPGAAVAAGVAGLAVGAMIGSALSQPRYYSYSPPRTYYAPAPADPSLPAPSGTYYAGGYAPGSSSWYAYCASKYRSFDPASGTYLGYDGRRHYCR